MIIRGGSRDYEDGWPEPPLPATPRATAITVAIAAAAWAVLLLYWLL